MNTKTNLSYTLSRRFKYLPIDPGLYLVSLQLILVNPVQDALPGLAVPRTAGGISNPPNQASIIGSLSLHLQSN